MRSSPGTGRRLALLLILLLATGLRFYRLDAQSFWNDEGNAARAAERSLDLILDTAEGDVHPPGYYLALHFWRALMGQSEFALRALSAMCGILTVALTYGLSRRLLGSGVGLLGALLVALSPLAIYYSQEARMYAPLGLLSAASTYLLCAMGAKGGRRLWSAARLSLAAGYVLTTAAGLYTHYTFPFVLIVHNLLFLGRWVARRRGGLDWRALLEWTGLQIVALLLFSPWFPVALEAAADRPTPGAAYALAPALMDLFRTLTVGVTLEEGAAWTLGLTGALLAAGMVGWRGRWGGVAALATWLVLPIALILGLDLYKPAYLKLLLMVLPPFQLLVAHGIWELSARAGVVWRGLTSAGRVVGMCLVLVTALPSLHNLYFDPAYARDDYRQIAADVAAAARPEDAVLLNAPNQWEVFTYYFEEPASVYPAPYHPTTEEAAAWLDPILTSHRRLFVLYWGDAEADPHRRVEGELAERAYKASDRWYGRVRVSVYGVGQVAEEPATAVDARFGDVMRLEEFRMGAGPFSPGDIVPLTLFWKAERSMSERYKVFLHLVGEQGELVAQVDTEPRDNLLPTTVWSPGERVIDRYGVLLPGEVESGEYTLVVGLYHLVTGERLEVTLGEGAPSDRVILGTVVVGSGEG